MSTNVTERRQYRRFAGVREHGVLAVRIGAAKHVALINVSASGALVESRFPLRPGASIDLHCESAERLTTVRGRVYRCHVFRVTRSAVTYRAAVVFDAAATCWAAATGYQVPEPEACFRGHSGTHYPGRERV